MRPQPEGKRRSLPIRVFRRILRNLLADDDAGRRPYENNCIRCGVRFVCWNYVPGDYLEFGCYSANSFAYAYEVFESTRSDVASQLIDADRAAFQAEKPRFFAFDSFEGLPPSEKTTDDHPYLPKHWKKIRYAMSQPDFEAALSARGVDSASVRIVKGWYEQTLTPETKDRHQLTRASVIHIDCDYYESAIRALDFATDLVQDGTVIVFDDYNYFRGHPMLGERRAFSEWLSRNPGITATELARREFESVAFFLTVGR
jgi:hypothetical protein